MFNAHGRRRTSKAMIVHCVRSVLNGERRRAARISVVLVDDRAMVRINREFLSHHGTTDVISFPLGEGVNLEGEIYVNLDKAARQARQFGVSGPSEIARLVIHGTLHLTGEDDRTAREARRMKRKEDRYVAALFRRGTSQGRHERKGR